MNLRDQLRRILPEILPKNPNDSIKGTELIQLVKYRLNQNYSDATLRYHFSIMSCDPSSPIAKVEQGQGYFLRSTTLHSLESARNLIPFNGASLFADISTAEGVDIALSRANKFRAIFKRTSELYHKFPFAFERSFSSGEPPQNHWRFPDVALVEWLVGDADENGSIRLDPRSLKTRRHMGGAPFRISAVKLKLDTHHGSIREDIFKALSAGLWSNTAELVIAAELKDEQLVDDVRALADRFGVGVTSYGLTSDTLDDMPESAAILNFTPREIEALQALFKIRRISLPKDTGKLDWESVNQYRSDSADFATLYDWISECLMDGQAYPLDDYLETRKAGSKEPAMVAVG